MNKLLLIIIAFAALNALPLLGLTIGLIDKTALLYVYWAEAVLVAGVAVFLFYAKYVFVFLLLLLGAGSFWLMSDQALTLADFKIPMTFWGFYALCWLAYFEIGNSSIGLELKRLHPLKQFGLYLGFMGLAISFCLSLTASMYNIWDDIPQIAGGTQTAFLVIAVLIPTLSIGILKIINMVGARHVLYFLLGTYHRPVEKECVIMFTDMVGSSGIAEKLSTKESMRFIAKVIFDMSAIVHKYGGDILSFTGDGLAVIWPVSQAERAVSAVYGMRTRFDKIRPHYEQEFGEQPRFRIGLHAGKVVISQIGEQKLFLGLYGDAVNTAARMEQMNKELGTEVLMSETVVDQLHERWMGRLHSHGEQEIRGREEQLEVFTIKTPKDNV